MASTDFYGSVVDADAYFQTKLFETAWSQAAGTDRPISLIEATRIIDRLSYKGFKHTVYELLQSDPDIAKCAALGDKDALAQIRTAEAAQALEFPRGADTITPEIINCACYEIAYNLLDGVDPDMELENLTHRAQGISTVTVRTNTMQEPLEHLINGVPSAKAWNWLRPFLRDDRQVRMERV